MELRRLRQLEDENSELKKLVADLSLDKDMLQEAIRKKDLRPAQVRLFVHFMVSEYRVSVRRACRVVALARSTFRYQPAEDSNVSPSSTPAGDRHRPGPLRLLARVYAAAARRLVVNQKRVYRLYKAEGLICAASGRAEAVLVRIACLAWRSAGPMRAGAWISWPMRSSTGADSGP